MSTVEAHRASTLSEAAPRARWSLSEAAPQARPSRRAESKGRVEGPSRRAESKGRVAGPIVGGATYPAAMPEPIDAWWHRRQRSKARDVPYELGTFRDEWAHYPALQRQFHPDLNGGIALSQVPPAADVLLLWQCELGHRFAATPWEQRQRPTGSRRKSIWCPECTLKSGASPRPARRPAPRRLEPMPKGLVDVRPATCERSPAARLEPGAAFASPCSPPTASAAEAVLRALLDERLDLGLTADARPTAVRTKEAFFNHLEVWPDIVIDELRVAIEYDTTGRDGLEHVGQRLDIDRRKDRLLRATGWEVIRIRTGHLPDLGPHDLEAPGVSGKLADRIVDRLRELRGALIVDAYAR